jgi:tyrosinase
MEMRKKIERQELRSLTPEQLSKLFLAINQLKDNGVYSKFVEWHGTAMMTKAGTEEMTARNLAHYSPVFLPWHREFLIRFENALREIDTSISLPYWDWTIDAEMEDPTTSVIWTEDFLGSPNPAQNGLVIDGPFKDWKYDSLDIPGLPPQIYPLYLTRPFDNSEQLPFKSDVEFVINTALVYDKSPWDTEQEPPYSFRILLEIPIHNTPHRWIGGLMGEVYSPGDPVFFLHHCNIDRIWANWQKKHNYLNEYPPNDQIVDRNGQIIQFTNRNHKMSPWNDINDKIVEEVLDFTQFYEYKEYYVS